MADTLATHTEVLSDTLRLFYWSYFNKSPRRCIIQSNHKENVILMHIFCDEYNISCKPDSIAYEGQVLSFKQIKWQALFYFPIFA